MRIFAVAFWLSFACATGHAQNLDWTYAVDPPTTFSYDSSYLGHARSDATGNACVVLVYVQEGRQIGFQMLWLDNKGRLIFGDQGRLDGDQQVEPRPWRVSHNDLLVAFQIHDSIPARLRRYSRTGAGISVSDLQLMSGEFLPMESDTGTFDDVGGFMVFGGPGGTPPITITSIARYTVK